jgi:hypothetical protein
LTLVAPCRTAVRTQSIAVSPPPITTTRLPSAFSVAVVEVGHLVAEALAVRRSQIIDRAHDAALRLAARQRAESRLTCRRLSR